jgi:7,8-dihydropterin-6-yl-methyl-4-(beta-D-ribofuranosyl)aminobenzene 5'-phosphate synthase
MTEGRAFADNLQILDSLSVAVLTELDRHGAIVVNNPEEHLLDGHFYYSGESPRVTTFEKGRDYHLCRKSPEAPWEPDPLLLDERMLVAKVHGLGLIVFSSCSHAGIVNVCTRVRTLFPDIPIHAVMGGLHLGGVMERNIPETVDGLRPFNIAHIITGHCTGWRALRALANALVKQSASPPSVRRTPSRQTD